MAAAGNSVAAPEGWTQRARIASCQAGTRGTGVAVIPGSQREPRPSDGARASARAPRARRDERRRLGVMVLYVVRHGRAEEPRGGLADEDRALTERGRREVRAVLARTGAAPV